MLTNLTIRHIGLIEAADLDFQSGLTVLTGETGAGKTMLLTSLGLVLGQRAEAGQIASGQPTAEVTAHFTPTPTPQLAALLQDQGLPMEEGALIIRRQLQKTEAGLTTRAWVGGTPVPLGTLTALGDVLVEHQSQHAATALLHASAQREVFDNLAGAGEERAATAITFAAWKAAETELQTLESQQSKAEARQDILKAWLEELDTLSPLAGEFLTLSEQRHRAASSGHLLEKLSGVTEGLDATLQTFRSTSIQLDKLSVDAPDLTPQAETLTRILSELEDASHALSRHQAGLEAPELSVEELDDRLHAYKSAARKHHTTPEELPATWEGLQAEAATLTNLSTHIAAAHQAVGQTAAAYTKAAQALTAKRAAAAPQLVASLLPHLVALNMPHAQFSVAFPAAAASSFGLEDVQFLFSANTGHPQQPIGKIASGGELSRLLLALKAVTYAGQPSKTLVLDEADTGIGGATAAAVGAAMAQLAATHQVLTITHHPQVAACATHHLKISKLSGEQTTRTTVTPLSGEGRVEELARMLAGQQVTEQAREAARTLLAQSQPAPAKKKSAA